MNVVEFPALMGPAEAAEALGVSKQVVHNWMSRGKIPCITVARRVRRVPGAEIVARLGVSPRAHVSRVRSLGTVTQHQAAHELSMTDRAVGKLGVVRGGVVDMREVLALVGYEVAR